MRRLLGIVVVVATLSVGLVAYSYTEEVHPCTHPGTGRCPGSSVDQSLHCESCSHPEHSEGCLCIKDFPCGEEYDEGAYCTPAPRY